MKKLIISIFCFAAIAASGQRTPYNLQSIMTKETAHKTASIPQYQKWKMDPAIHSAYIDNKIEELADYFIRIAPDTIIMLEHNLMDEWFIRVQYIRSDADQYMYTLDNTGKVINKIRPFTGVVIGSDDGGLKISKLVDKVDPYVNVANVTQVLATGEEGMKIQRELDELLSKF